MSSLSGLTNAVGTVMQGVSWQRCRVHFMRNALAKVNKGHAGMVAATIRTIVAQPGPTEVRARVDDVARMLKGRVPRRRAAAARRPRPTCP